MNGTLEILKTNFGVNLIDDKDLGKTITNPIVLKKDFILTGMYVDVEYAILRLLMTAKNATMKMLKQGLMKYEGNYFDTLTVEERTISASGIEKHQETYFFDITAFYNQ